MANRETPITEIIQQRFSCRTYLERPIEVEKQQRLQELMDALRAGPLGAPLRFKLAAASEQDRSSLKGLGTYGFIKGATGFIIGATKSAPMNLEVYGYALERIVLWTTELGLGSCWLGGTFTRSAFAVKIAAARDEQIPAVIAIGLIADVEQAKKNVLRRMAGSDGRLPWERLFFDQAFGAPLTREAAGVYATPLEMVRLGPSASNKQPWRIVREGDAWHFYVQRNRGYPPGLAARLLKIADMQRVDMGIAMCHWALTVEELGLRGQMGDSGASHSQAGCPDRIHRQLGTNAMNDEYQITLTDSPAQADLQVLGEGLNGYNAAQGAPADWLPLALFLRDEQGSVVGGAERQHLLGLAACFLSLGPGMPARPGLWQPPARRSGARGPAAQLPSRLPRYL